MGMPRSPASRSCAKGLSPLATTISTDTAAPVICGMRLRAGKAGSGKGAASMIARQSTTVAAAIAAIPGDVWTSVRYPGALRDPDTGAWICDAEVAEIRCTAFTSTETTVTARSIARGVNDARYPDALFPAWRYHPFFTYPDEPVTDADITHRRHGIIETVFSGLIDDPLAHMPSGRFGANGAWILCAAIARSLRRASATPSGGRHAVARGATIRRKFVNIPARLARPQHRPILHLPSHWPWSDAWQTLWHNIIGWHAPPQAAPA